MKKLSICLAVSALLLSSCSWKPEKEIVTVEKVITPTIAVAQRPKPIEMLDAKIEQIEDISADNRAIIVKLVKQNNQIIEFLRSLELEIIDNSSYETNPNDEKYSKLMALVEDFKESSKEFKKFLKEIEEHKDDITPGQFGES